MPAYYNENDPFAARWLLNLIKDGLIETGEVDDRSIVDVTKDDLAGRERCHFFAGIGGWALALDLAGWPRDRPAWTGSCPCQPFSAAGQRSGFLDERHLWPAFHALIAECRPPVVFGEQVAGPDGLEWLARVRADLEATGYAVGAADLPAAGFGAPQTRQRLYWVADASGGRRREDWHEIQGEIGGCGCAGFWSRFVELRPREGEPARRIEPGTMPMADGVPSYLDQLRAYGNAIVPQIGAAFVKAFMDSRL